MRFSGHHISGYHLQKVVTSIGSKPADKLVPNCCHSLHMQDNSWEHLGMIQQVGVEGLLLVSMHKGVLADSCFHKLAMIGRVGTGMVTQQLHTVNVKGT